MMVAEFDEPPARPPKRGRAPCATGGPSCSVSEPPGSDRSTARMSADDNVRQGPTPDKQPKPTPRGASRPPRTFSRRREFWYLLRDHRAVGIASAIIGLVGIALAIIAIRAPQWITGEQPLEIDQEGSVGPLSLRVSSVECGLSVDDLSEGYRQAAAEGLPEGRSLDDAFEGQICLASVTLRNDSNASLFSLNLFGTLLVGEREFPMSDIDQRGEDTPLVFPDATQELIYIFEVSEGIDATGLTLIWTEPGNEDEIAVNV